MGIDTTITYDDLYAALVKSNAEGHELRMRTERAEKRFDNLREVFGLYARIMRECKGVAHPRLVADAIDAIVATQNHLDIATQIFREHLEKKGA